MIGMETRVHVEVWGETEAADPDVLQLCPVDQKQNSRNKEKLMWNVPSSLSK